MDKTLMLIRGVSGSGKTTFAKTLTKYEIAADYYFYKPMFMEGEWSFLRGYEFDPSKLNSAHQWCQRTVREWMSLTVNQPNIIAVHNTFTKDKEIAPYMDMAEDCGYNVVSLVVENRHGNKDVHGVPEKVIDRQIDCLRKSIKLN